jgi:hypothetical protein
MIRRMRQEEDHNHHKEELNSMKGGPKARTRGFKLSYENTKNTIRRVKIENQKHDQEDLNSIKKALEAPLRG